MTAMPPPINDISSLIDAEIEAEREKPRAHLGCSLLGHHCARYLWLQFHWAVIEKFSGRVLRLFKRGQLEEQVVIGLLRRIGIDVRGTQKRVEFGWHIGGSLDGIIESGVPEAKLKRHVLEIKTHNLKSFSDLTKKGVVESKPQHHIQMQLYMHGTGIDRALYVAVCKDDDSLYTERVRYNKETAEKALDRGMRIVKSNRIPERISEDSTWYQCVMCGCHDFCHVKKLTSEVNCRTCAHSTALESCWRCERHDSDDIPYDFQLEGCEHHVLHPELVPWPVKETESAIEATWLVGEYEIRNGEPGEYVFSSKEIVSNVEACIMAINGEGRVNEVRVELEGEIVG